eukprot:14640682-Ditylum_brightwellii.AAC.1
MQEPNKDFITSEIINPSKVSLIYLSSRCSMDTSMEGIIKVDTIKVEATSKVENFNMEEDIIILSKTTITEVEDFKTEVEKAENREIKSPP